MKNNKIILHLCLLSMICLGCSVSNQTTSKNIKFYKYKGLGYAGQCLQRNTNRAIRKAMLESDTLYAYGVTFNNWIILWYHSNKHIHSCVIYPHKIRWQEPVQADNLRVDSVSFNLYTGPVFYRDLPCFVDCMDGEFIDLIVNGHKRNCSIQTECLFSHEFPIGSFPYKMQYDLSKILLR